ncbi:MAG: undecaprenyl-diphosphate phosphatase [Chthonomonas sp.]|nr:undecaprenyl-diphosphate phosphatase [Chthonomonas sp.]
MDLIQAIVLGVIQGLTEFLPVSSSAHIRIVPSLLGWPDPGAAFTANIQLGTLLAVLIYFWKDLSRILKGWVASLANPAKRGTTESKLGWGIAIGSIPIIVLGYLLKDQIETSLRSLYVIAGMLVFMAILLWIAEKFSKKTRDLDSLTPKDGLIIGLFQAIALIPGASRSGSTITGGLLLGLDRETAARYSFLLSVPSIFLAAVYTAFKHRAEFSGAVLTPLLVANAFSFIVGYACIAFLINFLKNNSNAVFIGYRILLGAAILALLATGKLSEFAGM